MTGRLIGPWPNSVDGTVESSEGDFFTATAESFSGVDDFMIGFGI
jgi:hypothetical protein